MDVVRELLVRASPEISVRAGYISVNRVPVGLQSPRGIPSTTHKTQKLMCWFTPVT